MLRASALAILALTSTGCASFTTYLAPRATPVGAFEVAGSASALAYVEDSGRAEQLPNLDLMARYGVAPGIDLGVKLGTVNLLVDSRMNLVQARGFELAVAPGLGFAVASKASGHQQGLVTIGSLPLVAGFRLDRDIVLVTGLKVLAHYGRQVIREPDGDGTVERLRDWELVLHPGALVGVELGISERFALLPELDVHFPYLPRYDKLARPVYQGGISFQFRFPS